MNRRQFLISSAVTSAFESLTRSGLALSGADPSIRNAASHLNIKAGVCAEFGQVKNSPLLSKFIIDNFALVVPNNELKWDFLQPTEQPYRFGPADSLLSFAESHGMAMRGHNLIWNSATPLWVGKTLDRTNATKIMADHVSTIVKRYGTKLESWDVVNEPLQPASKAKRKDDLLTPGPWLDALGEEYIDLAYHLTKEANPEVLRVVNIFAVEHDTPEHETDRAAALNLLRRLLKRGVPIQAVGFESHIDALTPIGGRGVETFVNQILDMGLQILITELDVSDYAVKGDIAVRDRVVAQRYYDYLVLMVPLTKTNRVLFWSPTDAGNWMDWSRPHGRPDGTKFRPGLLDVDMAPKVAFTRVLDALEHIHSN